MVKRCLTCWDEEPMPCSDGLEGVSHGFCGTPCSHVWVAWQRIPRDVRPTLHEYWLGLQRKGATG